MAEENVYAPPSSAVSKAESGAELLLPRTHLGLVLVLAIFTFGIYVLYWLYTRTIILNRARPADPVSYVFVWAAIFLRAISLLLDFLAGFQSASHPLQSIVTIFDLLSALLLVIWVFAVRNRLNRLFDAGPSDTLWLRWPWTFLFQVIYLQYKINQAISTGAAAIRKT